MTDTPVLATKNLKKYFDESKSLSDWVFRRDPEPVQAVDDVTVELQSNKSIGIIGESGCGKSTLLKTLMGLHDPSGGDVLYKGKRMANFDKSDWRAYRRNVQIIFQDPFNSINPKKTVRESLIEPLDVHNVPEKGQKVRDVLHQVELGPPERYLNRRPNQLSGGELQRVAIARALILEPDVLLADEPVSMLDVSTQASILKLLSNLITDLDISMLYISHDLSTVSYVCDQINVMYLGRVVEKGPTTMVTQDPQHPYSQALINAIPIPDPHHEREIKPMDGSPQDPIGLGPGCRFRDRCPDRMDICDVTPESITMNHNETQIDREVACHLHYEHDEITRGDA